MDASSRGSDSVHSRGSSARAAHHVHLRPARSRDDTHVSRLLPDGDDRLKDFARHDVTESGRILIVDDTPANLVMLSAILERRGYEVRTGKSGADAIRLACKHPPDLILLDIEMPDLRGFEVCQQLRTFEALVHVPVIFISAHQEQSEVVTAFSSGAVDYISKPFFADELCARVETHLKLSRLQRELEDANKRLADANRRMSRELASAARVQWRFVPQAQPACPDLNFAWIYKPCSELGGDGLNILEFNDGTFGLYVLDVSGHGVASALLSVAMSRMLASIQTGRETVFHDPDSFAISPARVVSRLHELFPFEATTTQFATMTFGVIDPKTGEFRYASAGHPGPIVTSASTGSTVLTMPGFPIGIGDGAYTEQVVRLHPDDRLYLYSDGVLEVARESDQFGIGRLTETLQDFQQSPLQFGLDELMQRIAEWNGSDMFPDDVSILAVEFTGAGK